jgi:hypothetical protein
MRAVRIAFDIAEVVVLAVYRYPLPRRDARQSPGCETHDHGHGWMQPDGAMRQHPVQKHRGYKRRNLGQYKPYDYGYYVFQESS